MSVNFQGGNEKLFYLKKHTNDIFVIVSTFGVFELYKCVVVFIFVLHGITSWIYLIFNNLCYEGEL